MRGDHPRKAAEDGSGPAVEEIKAEHRKRKVRSRDRDQAVQVDPGAEQGLLSGTERESGRERRKGRRTAASSWFAPTA